MWRDALSEIIREKALYGEQVNCGAAETEISRFRMAVQDALGAELPAEYADFLRTVNGVLFNGYTVCGIDRHLLSEAPVQPVTGLLENNQVWHENEWMKQFLFIGDSDISWYVFDAAHGKYCELDKPSGCCVTCFCSFADMLETILRNSLK